MWTSVKVGPPRLGKFTLGMLDLEGLKFRGRLDTRMTPRLKVPGVTSAPGSTVREMRENKEVTGV